MSAKPRWYMNVKLMFRKELDDMDRLRDEEERKDREKEGDEQVRLMKENFGMKVRKLVVFINHHVVV